jgi:hypothetical protein
VPQLADTLERLVRDPHLYVADVRQWASMASRVEVDPLAVEGTASLALDRGDLVLTIDPDTRDLLYREA